MSRGTTIATFVAAAAAGLAVAYSSWIVGDGMAERSSGNRWLIVALAAIGVAIGVWLAMDREHRAPDAGSGAAVAPSDDPGAPAPPPSSAPVPALRIAEGGRISIDAASLRDVEVLALRLALADEARGSEPLSVRVVSLDGRRIETTAAPAAGSGSGLRLELEPEWLRPGRYLIEVTTAERTHFPLRRYVIEVGDSRLADPEPAPTGEQRSGQQEPQ